MRYAIVLAPITALAFLACGGATTPQPAPAAETLTFVRDGDKE